MKLAGRWHRFVWGLALRAGLQHTEANAPPRYNLCGPLRNAPPSRASMDRIASIRRYREDALNATALMAAIASARFDQRGRLFSLSGRLDEQLEELLHDFAFRARKLIELSEAERFPIKAIAEARIVPGMRHDELASAQGAEDDLPLYSLWYIMNRVIHSENFEVERTEVQLDGGHYDIFHELPWGFWVGSDKDGENIRHFIWLDFFLEQWLAIDEAIELHLRIYERTLPSSGSA